jgi:hypothetical protein
MSMADRITKIRALMMRANEAEFTYKEVFENEKFPHYVVISFRRKPDVNLLMDINDWLKNTYGSIGDKWGMYHYNRDVEHLYEFRFADKAHAAHFKLVWG